MTTQQSTSGYILDVKRFCKMDGDWACRCPHCKKTQYLGDDGIPRGEQFTCKCGEMFGVTSNAILVEHSQI